MEQSTTIVPYYYGRKETRWYWLSIGILWQVGLSSLKERSTKIGNFFTTKVRKSVLPKTRQPSNLQKSVNCLYPLKLEEKWEFGKYAKKN